MTLPAPIQRAKLALRQAWDVWMGSTTASSTAMIAWDASKTGDRLGQWWPPSADFSSYLNPALLKNRARDSYRNNPWARRAIDLLRHYSIGIGLKPMIDLSDAQLRARVLKLWAQWSEQADFNGFHSFAGLQGEAFKTALVDGECLALIRPGPVLKIQLLADEFFATQKDNGIDIGGGIQYDSEGRRLGYWLYDKIPPKALNPVPYFVPQDRVVHLFQPLGPGHERGVSALAPALVPLYELQSFMESSLVRARTGSLFAGFIRSADSTPILTPTPEGPTPFEPGSIARLRPGDEISFTQPPDPSQAYAGFISTQLRAIASALDVSYELLANDVGAITFASGRHSLLAFQRVCESYVQWFAFQFCAPIWRWWCKIQIASGELSEEILTAPVRWLAPPIETLDARMTTNSTLQKIRAGILSRSEAVSGTGIDPEALDEQIAADNARADKLGLIYDSDPRRVSTQGIFQPGEETDGTPKPPTIQ